MKIKMIAIWILVSLSACESAHSRYLPYQRGCLNLSVKEPKKLISPKILLIEKLNMEFVSLTALLDFLFERDVCFLSVGKDKIFIRSTGNRQATVFVKVKCFPLPLSGAGLEHWLAQAHPPPRPSMLGMIDSISFDEIEKIEWSDSLSDGSIRYDQTKECWK